MPQFWLTIEEAAVRLKTSVRTLQRKVSAGTIESRMEGGRREVLIDVGDPTSQSAMADPAPDASAAAAGQTYGQVGQVPPTVGQGFGHIPPVAYTAPDISQALAVVTDAMADKAELAIVAYQGLARNAELMANRYRVETRIYQAAAGVLIVGLLVAVGVAVRSATKAETSDAFALHASGTTASVGQERDKLRDELIKAREAAARAEGRREGEANALAEAVSVIKAAAIHAPTTQPTTQPATRPSLTDNFADASGETAVKSD
jgi:excisionase family DNA binding protein